MFFDVVLYIIVMLHYIIFYVAVFIFSLLQYMFFFMLHYIFLRCCSIYILMLHYIVFCVPFGLDVCLSKYFMLQVLVDH